MKIKTSEKLRQSHRKSRLSQGKSRRESLRAAGMKSRGANDVLMLYNLTKRVSVGKNC